MPRRAIAMAGPAVVDTNVVVAGLLTSDPEAATVRILDALLVGRLRFVLSMDLLAEYRTVLIRPRISSRHGLSDSEVDLVLTRLAAHARVIDAIPRSTQESRASLFASRTPTGDRHLGFVLDALPSALLVTGDERLAKSVGARAISARAFLDKAAGSTRLRSRR